MSVCIKEEMCICVCVWRGGSRGFQNLWVLQKRLFVVSTAATAVQHGISVLGPASKVHHLIPGLMDANHWGVDKTANICLSEELAPVYEWHPVDPDRHCIKFKQLEVKPNGCSVIRHSPELSIVLHCDAEVASFCVADFVPFWRANNKQGRYSVIYQEDFKRYTESSHL